MSNHESEPDRFQKYRELIQKKTPHNRTLRTLRFYAGETGRLDVDQRSEMDEALENFYQSAVADAVEIALEAGREIALDLMKRETPKQDGPEREAEYWKHLAELYRAGLLEIVKADPDHIIFSGLQEIARGTLRDAEQEFGHPAGPGAPEDGQDE
jgi:histone H3/H4